MNRISLEVTGDIPPKQSTTEYTMKRIGYVFSILARKPRKNTFFSMTGLILSVLCVIMSPMSHAKTPDRQQPINISADSANVNTKQGYSVYQGNAVMTQGSTQLKGDTIKVYTQNKEISRIVALGQKKPAYFEEKQNEKKGHIEAWGYTINYDIPSEHIELTQQAQLSQNGDMVKGENIAYSMKNGTVTAKGSNNKNKSTGRVQMVIQPRANNSSTSLPNPEE